MSHQPAQHQPTQRNLSRRKALAGIGTGGLIFAQGTTKATAQEEPTGTENLAVDAALTRYPAVSALKSQPTFQEGDLVETSGFHMPGDGGGALYRIRPIDNHTRPNEADVIALKDGLAAFLQENEAVNYRMFGALSDGKNDDGVQIKLAHEYAERHRIPIVNLSGDFWIHGPIISPSRPTSTGVARLFTSTRNTTTRVFRVSSSMTIFLSRTLRWMRN